MLMISFKVPIWDRKKFSLYRKSFSLFNAYVF